MASSLHSRFLGLELAGAKNHKTTLAVLEFYTASGSQPGKLFLTDLYDKIVPLEGQSSDQALIDLIDEVKNKSSELGVDVPLTLPPCLGCTRKKCIQSQACTHPHVVAMSGYQPAHTFTPYTQRPVELWMKREELVPFEIDEALGGNKAPLTARMQFLQRHLGKLETHEVWPKLTLHRLARRWKIPDRWLRNYRSVDEGAHARQEILDIWIAKTGLFVYDGDYRKLTQHLTCFDALLCAYTVFLRNQGDWVRPPASFPKKSGWICFPKGA